MAGGSRELSEDRGLLGREQEGDGMVAWGKEAELGELPDLSRKVKALGETGRSRVESTVEKPAIGDRGVHSRTLWKLVHP